MTICIIKILASENEVTTLNRNHNRTIGPEESKKIEL